MIMQLKEHGVNNKTNTQWCISNSNSVLAWHKKYLQIYDKNKSAQK